VSNYHILEMSKKKNSITVAYHIPVPNWSNNAENNEGPNPQSLRTCLVEYLTRNGAVITTQVPGLSTKFASEWSGIENGIIFEHVKTHEISADLEDSERFAFCDGKYTTFATRKVNQLKKILRLWGSDKDVT
jgi:hypothetical protein